MDILQEDLHLLGAFFHQPDITTILAITGGRLLKHVHSYFYRLLSFGDINNDYKSSSNKLGSEI
ncbi:hypothetical protein H5410_059585 [Solanum commersonii]|uniref:Uncharacterized protein n=1 Tax=Solanum commersonii TaxID=4109 RepID=A0A9J5W2T1_SOLCO|nr:hypothetical protein H5410_059585 [Solanum commersonii]